MGKEPIQPFSSVIKTEPGFKIEGSKKGNFSFQKILSDLIEKVSDLEKNADESIKRLITGEVENIHQVMIAAEEANLAFQLMMEIRNKLVEAYKEIMRMQI